MTRTLGRSLLAALAAALLFAPSAFAAKGFSLGVAAGETSTSSAILWGHATKSGRYTLQVARDRRFRKGLSVKPVRARASHDNTVQAEVGRLTANTRYHYRFVGKGGKKSDLARSSPHRRRSRTPRCGSPGAATPTSTPSPARPLRTGTRAASSAG